MEMMDTPKGIVRCQDGDTWDDMMEWKKKKKLTITAMRRINIRTQAEHGDLECGILPGKVYYVQDLVETNGRRMMKLKNPWGMSPWTGKWSYGSNMWEENVEVMEVLNVDSKKKKIDVFWMEWEDFSRIFNTLYATADTCAWFTKRREGVYPDKGGGCPTYKTWKANPQYALEFENETEVIIDLSLPDTRVEAAAGRGVKVPAKYDKSIGFVLAAFDWGTPESPQRLTRIVREQCGDYCTMMFKPVRTVEHKVGPLKPAVLASVPQSHGDRAPSLLPLCIFASQCVSMRLYVSQCVSMRLYTISDPLFSCFCSSNSPQESMCLYR
jgi:hypothetical protein